MGCSGSGGDDSQTTTTAESLFGEPLPTLPSRQITEGTAACGLLRSAEVQEAIGTAVNSGRGIERDGSGSSCTWLLTSDGTQNVSVAATPGDKAAFQRVLDQGGPQRRRLEGVGEGALVGGGSAVSFKSGTLVIITVNVGDDEQGLESAAEALIRAAMPRV